MAVAVAKSREDKIRQIERISKKLFKRFAKELEERTNLKFKVDLHFGTQYRIHYDAPALVLKQHLGFMKNPKALSLLVSYGHYPPVISMDVHIHRGPLLRPVKELLDECQRRWKRKLDTDLQIKITKKY